MTTERDNGGIWLALAVGAAIFAWGFAGWHDSQPEPKPMPTMAIPPLQKQVRCPEWQPGLSRTVVIYVTELEDGTLSTECIRIRERGRRYVL